MKYKRYYVIENRSGNRSIVDDHYPARVAGRPRYFYSKEDAKRWIDQHSFPGMVFKYEIGEEEYI